jgi:hypothetical protein
MAQTLRALPQTLLGLLPMAHALRHNASLVLRSLFLGRSAANMLA